MQIDSAQITVFDFPPPSVPCRGRISKLKLFHELSDAELNEFKMHDQLNFIKVDVLNDKCPFCGTRTLRLHAAWM
ncbi:hypothetical protein AAVH_01043 [Aphelenchoides avenae]|nr:hypothetical protein AAVH_01043 [Aphelenchus avenae]